MSQSLGDGRTHGALLLGAFCVLLALIAAVFLMTSADRAAADNCNTVSGAPFPNSPCDNRKHQSDEGGTTAFVTLVDETGSAWRVFARAIEWDAAGRLDLVYRSGTCGASVTAQA